MYVLGKPVFYLHRAGEPLDNVLGWVCAPWCEEETIIIKTMIYAMVEEGRVVCAVFVGLVCVFLFGRVQAANVEHQDCFWLLQMPWPVTRHDVISPANGLDVEMGKSVFNPEFCGCQRAGSVISRLAGCLGEDGIALRPFLVRWWSCTVSLIFVTRRQDGLDDVKIHQLLRKCQGLDKCTNMRINSDTKD